MGQSYLISTVYNIAYFPIMLDYVPFVCVGFRSSIIMLRKFEISTMI